MEKLNAVTLIILIIGMLTTSCSSKLRTFAGGYAYEGMYIKDCVQRNASPDNMGLWQGRCEELKVKYNGVYRLGWEEIYQCRDRNEEGTKEWKQCSRPNRPNNFE